MMLTGMILHPRSVLRAFVLIAHFWVSVILRRCLFCSFTAMPIRGARIENEWIWAPTFLCVYGGTLTKIAGMGCAGILISMIFKKLTTKTLSVSVAALLAGSVIAGSLSGCSSRRVRKANEDVSRQDTATFYIDAIDFNPVINVYIENSGSMDGYVKGQTEFEQIVYNYLVNLKLARITSKLNLFYINSEILPQQDDVQDFIEKLNPYSFKAKGGNRGTSDISQMIDTIMKEMNDSTVSIFISDCIFSPGKGKDAGDYLNNQKIGIKKAIGEYFNAHPKLAVTGYRCMSSFDGYCYDKNDTGTLFIGQRPFYIWLFGTQGALRRIQNEMHKNGYHLDGCENEFMAFAGGITIPDSCYAVKRGSGNFDLKKSDSRHSIENLKADRNGKVCFSVEVNYAPLILSDTYLCDTTMYVVNDPKYKVVSVERIKEYQKYSHIIHIEAEKVHPSNLEIQLCTGTPTWPAYYNDDSGNSIDSTNAYKTFGIKYLTEGITEAIIRKNYYTRMIININK